MKYLIATDGSVHANRAVTHTAKSAHKQDTIYILMCYQPIVTLASAELANSEYATQELKVLNDGALRIAEEAKSKILLENNNLSAENIITLTESGDARDSILDVAKEKHVDCIVVGSRGAGSLSKAILGSVSDYVIKNSTCSVLVVK